MPVLEQDQLKRLEEAIEKTGKLKDYYVRKVRKKIERYIEDFEDISLAEEISADIRSGKTKTIPYEEIKEELLREERELQN